MNLNSGRARLTVAISAVVLAGIVALIFRAVDNEPPEVQTPVSVDVQPDLLDEQLPTSSHEPSPEPTPRRRTGSTRSAPTRTSAPQPAPSDLSPLDDLPAAPDPRPVDPGEL